MSIPDKIFEIHSEEGMYRLVPDPEFEPGNGYYNGGILQWQPYEADAPTFGMRIPATKLRAFAIAFTDAARDTSN